MNFFLFNSDILLSLSHSYNEKFLSITEDPITLILAVPKTEMKLYADN